MNLQVISIGILKYCIIAMPSTDIRFCEDNFSACCLNCPKILFYILNVDNDLTTCFLFRHL